MEDAEDRIQGNNSTVHCFVLRNLIPMNLFKEVMIMKLKMCTTRKTFGKICLKTIRDTFFQYMVCNQQRDAVRHEGKWEDWNFCGGVTSNGRVRFKILAWMGRALCWSPIKTILRSVLGVNTVIIWKRVCERIYFLSKQQINSR